MQRLLAALLSLICWCCNPGAVAPKAQVSSPNPMATSAVLVTPDGQAYCGGTWVAPRKVLTANHCVADWDAPGLVKDHDGRLFLSNVVKTDERSDLALLDVQLSPEHAFAALAKVWGQGEALTILGAPEGEQFVELHGWLAFERAHDSPTGDTQMQMLWVQAPAWYGDSGGGAFDDQGNLVGVCSMRSIKIPDQSWYIAPEEVYAFLALSR